MTQPTVYAEAEIRLLKDEIYLLKQALKLRDAQNNDLRNESCSLLAERDAHQRTINMLLT